MGDQVYLLKSGEDIPVEPVGSDFAQGWLAGTWVKYSSTAPTFTGVIASVERSDGTGVIAGFLLYGPQHKQAIELQSDMWRLDKLQRAGGDFHFDWTGMDAGLSLEFDQQGLVQKIGSRVCTMCVPPTGFFKFYVFEVYNKQERHNPGTGAALVYNPGDKLYVSENGLLTSEKETVSHTWTNYVVARYSSDDEGNYIICCAAVT